MIRHFFLDKTNTIIENSFQNLGLNPILHLGYGNGVIRGIVSFDISKIKDLVDKEYADGRCSVMGDDELDAMLLSCDKELRKKFIIIGD